MSAWTTEQLAAIEANEDLFVAPYREDGAPCGPKAAWVSGTRVGPPRLDPSSGYDRRQEQGMRAIWNDTVIAESDDTVVVENNHYFPRSSVREDLLLESGTTTFCPWKGTASYASIEVDGDVNEDALWFYPEPKDAAKEITDHVAFWKGVTVTA